MNDLLIISASTITQHLGPILERNDDEFEDEILSDLIFDLTGYNLYVIGSGGFSTVYEHPNDPTKVIKISRERSGDVWSTFMQLKNPNSPWFPKAYAFDTDDWCTVAVLDKMTPVRNQLSDDEYKIVLNITSAALSVVERQQDDVEFDEETVILNDLLRHVNPDHNRSLARTYLPYVHDMIPIVRYLEDNKISWIDDICRQNIMMLGDQLIISDPIA